jgi:glycosyltransferase involved in cell wall biosynthesis
MTKTDDRKMPVVLVVAMANSIHAARWLEVAKGIGVRFALVPALRYQPRIVVAGTRPVRSRAELDALGPEEIGLWARIGDGEAPDDDGDAEMDTLAAPIDVPDRHLVVRGATVRRAIVSLQPDLVHSMEIQWAGYACLVAARQLGAAFPRWLVSSWGSDIYLYRKFPEHAQILREIADHARACLVNCRRDLAMLRDLGFREARFPVGPASAGGDFSTFPTLGELSRPAQRRDIVVKGYHTWAGRGLHILSALHLAADRLRDYRFRVLLAGPPMVEMARLLRERDGLDVVIEPYLSNHEVIQLLANARAMVACGISDGIGTMLLEAMSVGAFPIVANTCCADEWIRPGKDGLVIDPHDTAALAAAIVTAAHDDALVDGPVARNRAEVERRWNRDHRQDIVRGIYHDVLAERSGLSGVSAFSRKISRTIGAGWSQIWRS